MRLINIKEKFTKKNVCLIQKYEEDNILDIELKKSQADFFDNLEHYVSKYLMQYPASDEVLISQALLVWIINKYEERTKEEVKEDILFAKKITEKFQKIFKILFKHFKSVGFVYYYSENNISFKFLYQTPVKNFVKKLCEEILIPQTDNFSAIFVATDDVYSFPLDTDLGKPTPCKKILLIKKEKMPIIEEFVEP